MKNIKYLYVLFVFCCSYANAQYIIAGQHSANDYYYKYTPDTVIKFYNPSTYLIDLNNDGVKDFKFTVLPYNDLLGATAYYCNVSGLNNNKVALAYFDSCFYKHYVSQYIIEIVQSFNYNDTININANWDSLVYIEDVYSSSQMGIQCFDSFTDSAYIGLKVFMGTQPVYGWIKIISTSHGVDTIGFSTYLTLGAFACENYGVGIKPLTNNNEGITVYPNPANNRIQVTSGSHKIILISIYDMLGKEMINTTEKEIDVSNLQVGIYFMQVKTSEGIFTKKVIIQR